MKRLQTTAREECKEIIDVHTVLFFHHMLTKENRRVLTKSLSQFYFVQGGFKGKFQIYTFLFFIVEQASLISEVQREIPNLHNLFCSDVKIYQ